MSDQTPGPQDPWNLPVYWINAREIDGPEAHGSRPLVLLSQVEAARAEDAAYIARLQKTLKQVEAAMKWDEGFDAAVSMPHLSAIAAVLKERQP